MRRVLTTFTLLLLIASPAAAQDAKLEQAKLHFDEGQSLYLQGKYVEAAAQFMTAYQLRGYPAFLFNVAVCFEKSRDFAKALEHYERYLREDPHSQDRSLVLKRIAAIRLHLNPPASQATSKPVAQQPPKLPPVETKGLVVIETKPEGAAIYLGDKTKGVFTRTPYTGSLPPGRQTVIIELKRYRTERKTFQVRSDRLVYLFFSLALERSRGWLEVKANVPGASVFVDSKDVGAVGTTPYTGWLRPGKHKVMVEREGYEPFEQQTTITAGDVHAVTARLTRVSHGWLKVTGRTTRGAQVKVDGKRVSCTGYPCRTTLASGTHQVEITRDGHKSYSRSVEVTAATETQLAVRLTPKPSRLKAYITFGVAAALLGGGITAGVISRNRKDSLEDDLAANRIYDSSDPRILEGKISSIVANSLFALSGAVGALGLYYLLRNEGPDPLGEVRTNKVALEPLLSPSVAGLAGKVRF